MAQQVGKGPQLVVGVKMHRQASPAVLVGHRHFAAQRLAEAFFHLHRQSRPGRRFGRGGLSGLFGVLGQLAAEVLGLADVQAVPGDQLCRLDLKLRRGQPQDSLGMAGGQRPRPEQLQRLGGQPQQAQAVGQGAAGLF